MTPARASTLLPLLLLGCLSCSREPPHRLIVLGFDGATWDVIDPMLQRGELPNFKAMIERGCRGTLNSIYPMKSPVIWTSIATGKFPREHNILDFRVPYCGSGPRVLVRSTFRRMPAIWNIASKEGRTVNVLGYYGTYPVEAVSGVMVASLGWFRRPGGVYPPERQPALLESVREIWGPNAIDQVTDQLVGWDYDTKIAMSPEHPHHAAAAIVQKGCAYEYQVDESYRRMLPQLIADRTDLLIAYFRITDSVAHSTWIFHDSTGYPNQPDPTTVALLGGLVQASYRYIDRILGDVVAQAPDTNIVVVSDHGMGAATGDWALKGNDIPDYMTGTHRFNGLFLAAGPDIRHTTVTGLSVMDVMPLMLTLLDLPYERDLPGQIPVAALREGFADDHPLRCVDDYDIEWESMPVSAADEAEGDKQGLEVLKGLGYVGGNDHTSTEGPRSGPGSFWKVDPVLRYDALLGELTHYVAHHNQAAIDRLRKMIVDHDPKMAGRLATQLKPLRPRAKPAAQ